MLLPDPVEMDVAVRAWAVPDDAPKPPYANTAQAGYKDLGPSPWTLTFDTETTLDPGQALRIGGYQLRHGGRRREEGLFYDPDVLTTDEIATVRDYAAVQGLKLRTRDQFADDVFLKTAWDRRGLVIGHNLPFDLARLSIANAPCQSRDKSMRGGFSLTLSRDVHRSHVQIKKTNAGAAFIRLTIPSGINPEHRNRQRGGKVRNHHGYFLDTATLGGAMLGGRPSLKRLAELLTTDARKSAAEHGEEINERYLDYLRQDVQVTWECWDALRQRYDAYRLPVPSWRIHSEASIGKAHLTKMQLTPFRALNRWPDHVLATVMETYYGGRAECLIRRVPVPGVYVDFTSQYPTVFALQGLQRFLTAERVEWAAEDPAKVQQLLDTITVDDALDPALWPRLDALVLVAPDGDRLPTRGRYARAQTRRSDRKPNRAYNVGVPYRTGGAPQWYTLADCIASKLMTGNAPTIVAVGRFTAHGRQPEITPIDMGGQAAYRVDPNTEDFIRRLVEQRDDVRAEHKKAKTAGDAPGAATLDAMQQGMKCTANGTAYGSPIELNPIEHRKPAWVTVHQPDGGSYRVSVTRTEQPGRWFHPLISTLVAGAGRLLLATAMRLVSELGGSYAFCDTDSLFIVATGTGGVVSCPGGAHQTQDGADAIKALSWTQVDEVVERFRALNPYAGPMADRSILKIEDENYNPNTGQQREIECYAIAAKRYGLFIRDLNGRPDLVQSGDKRKRSEHGLGHLLPPNAPSPDISDREWLDDWWQHLLRVELGYPSEEPAWFDAPAVGRMTVTSPRDVATFRAYNATRRYAAQVKPWGFLSLAHPAPHERARGVRCLIAPFERDPQRRAAMAWVDRDNSGTSQIRTSRTPDFIDGTTAVLSYRDYFEHYRQHPESKALDPTDTAACHPWTRGLLVPWSVRANDQRRVGKESNRLSDTQLPTEEPDEQVIEYPAATRRCRGCASLVPGRRRWCSERCRKRASRVRSTHRL
jgi:hypothetical protein